MPAYLSNLPAGVSDYDIDGPSYSEILERIPWRLETAALEYFLGTDWGSQYKLLTSEDRVNVVYDYCEEQGIDINDELIR